MTSELSGWNLKARRARRKPVVAVIGNGATPPPSLEALEIAAQLGRAVVNSGCRVITGGLGGIMEAASRGAHQAERWSDGDVIGVIPGPDPSAANAYVDVCVATGLGLARNLVVVTSADVVVAVLGGSGTLSEIALAWQLGKPVVALDLGHGWSHELAGRAIDDRRTDLIERACSVEEAIGAVERAVGTPGRGRPRVA